MKHRIWTVAFLVIVVCISTGVLNAVHIYTRPRVYENETIRMQRSVLEILSIPYEEANIRKTFEKNVDIQTIEGVKLYRSRDNITALEISGPGFWDNIYALIALEPDLETIKGLIILKHAETPGLGGRIAESWFQNQFKGKKLTPELKIVPYGKAKTPNEVDGITGATETSKALEKIINRNIASLRGKDD